jgi:hypothetical protein
MGNAVIAKLLCICKALVASRMHICKWSLSLQMLTNKRLSPALNVAKNKILFGKI